jgi:tripartite-type tricarboxylate transporter receptor subunit TctC
MQRRLFASLLPALLLALSGQAMAQGAFPNRPLRIIVPFTPGGGNDVYARAVGAKLSERLGQPVIVENKPGAGGNLGADFVAKSPPDGYTLLLAQNGLSMVPHLTRNLPFDVTRDLAPVGIGASLPLAVAVNNDLPVRNIPELLAYAKANPGKLSYATPGIGTPHHLATEWFLNLTGTRMVMVPYKGAAGMITDLIGGQVQVLFGALNSILPQHQSGKLRIIALAEKQRHPTFKDLPTISETVPGYETFFWFGLMAPAGTPEAILNRLSDEQRAIVTMPDVRERLAGAGFDIMPVGAAEMRRTMATELERWGKVVREANIKAE